MSDVPSYLKDSADLLSEQGFATSNRWYHGTATALLEAIQQDGLRGSGDQKLNAAAAQTMATIGNAYAHTAEPVYLTQSKQLAHYWAKQAVRRRAVRFGDGDEPAVIAVTLPDAINQRVRPDVGAATLLMLNDGENFMAYLAGMYQARGLPVPDIDLRNADRMAYLNVLGMAYLDADIDPDYLDVVTS